MPVFTNNVDSATCVDIDNSHIRIYCTPVEWDQIYALNSFGGTCNCYPTQYAGASQEFVVPEYNYAGYLPYLPYDNLNGKTCKTYIDILSCSFSISERDCFVCSVSPCCFRTRPENYQGVGQKEAVALQSWTRTNQQILKVTYFCWFCSRLWMSRHILWYYWLHFKNCKNQSR